MSGTQSYESLPAAITETAVGRRQLLGAAALLGAAGAVAGPAFAATGTAEVRAFRARYAIPGGRTVTGYFALPRGGQQMQIVVVMPGAEDVRARTEAVARAHAQAGNLVIAPDLARTFVGRGLMGRDAMIAEFMTVVPGLKRMARGNGTVRIVSA